MWFQGVYRRCCSAALTKEMECPRCQEEHFFFGCIVLMAACAAIALKLSSNARWAEYSELRQTIDRHYQEGKGRIDFDRDAIAGIGASEMMDILSSFNAKGTCSAKSCLSINVSCEGGEYCEFLRNEIQRTKTFSTVSKYESEFSLIVYERARRFRPSVHIYKNDEKKFEC